MGVFSKGTKTPPEAGSSTSVVDAKKPAYRGAGSSNYMPEEKINGGMGGGKKGKVSGFHGQNSDGSGEKDNLVPQTVGQKDPYEARGSDWPVKRVSPFSGQGAGEAGSSSGKNELARYNENQEGPRHVEDDGSGDCGSGTPVPGNRAGRVAAAFSVGVSMGESNSDTGEIGIAESVNLQTGYIEGGSSRTYVDEVPEDKLSIGAPPSRNMKAGLKIKNY